MWATWARVTPMFCYLCLRSVVVVAHFSFTLFTFGFYLRLFALFAVRFAHLHIVLPLATLSHRQTHTHMHMRILFSFMWWRALVMRLKLCTVNFLKYTKWRKCYPLEFFYYKFGSNGFANLFAPLVFNLFRHIYGL